MTSHERHVVSIVEQLMQTLIKETPKSALLALCEENSLVTSEFPTQSTSKAEKASIWWSHHDVNNSAIGVTLIKEFT